MSDFIPRAKMRYYKWWWPFTKVDDYNELVLTANTHISAREILEDNIKGLQKERDKHYLKTIELGKQITQLNDTIIGLRKQVADLEAKPDVAAQYTKLLEQVKKYNIASCEGGQLFLALKQLWNWRIENAKAGPTALAKNKEEITDGFEQVHAAWPKTIAIN